MDYNASRGRIEMALRWKVSTNETNRSLRAGCVVIEASRRDLLPPETPFSGRLIPAYDLLDDSALARIEGQADWILENIGVEFRGDRIALEYFADAGAKVTGNRVTFEPGHIRGLCKLAPSRVSSACPRSPKYAVNRRKQCGTDAWLRLSICHRSQAGATLCDCIGF